MKTPEVLDKEAREVLSSLPEVLTAKDRAGIPHQEMPQQDPKERIHNMSEVALGYTESEALVEACRCLQCRNKPCVSGCPVGIDIPRFIKSITEKDYPGAMDVIQESSLLPAICGRVCPQENQCQKYCTVGKMHKNVDEAVAIGRLERFVADHEKDNAKLPEVAPATGKKVAVVGSGPASIACAADVRRMGHSVTVFEALHKMGGVLSYGIPEFRLPKSLVEKELSKLEAMGIEFQRNVLIGRTRTIKELMEEDGYDAVFIGTGAGLPKFMNIPGENLISVFSANEYLTRSNLMKAYDTEHSLTPYFHSHKVAVFGGGNVAMDAARTALRLGAETVDIVYRRTRDEMPARKEEIEHAIEEGCNLRTLSQPVEIIGDDNGIVRGVVIRRCELGEPDASGRRSPVEIPGSDYTVDYDTVIVAIGNASNPLIKKTTPEIETNKRGNFIVDEETNETSMKGVFAGGDIVLGAATVILAMGQGRKAAAAINAYLEEKA